MNAPLEIYVREAFSRGDLPEQSPSLVFAGTREAMAAYLIEWDSAQWECAKYIIFDNGPVGGRTADTRHWQVWRR
jgi:hypothetical protein